MALLASLGVIAAFVRLHPLLNRVPPRGLGVVVEHGDTVSIDLTLAEEDLWRQTRRDHRHDISRSLAAGHRPYFDEAMTHFGTFKRLYLSTMQRVSADPFYFFDDAYFEGLRIALGDRMHLCVVEVDGEIAAGGLFVETAGIVEYHLSAASPSLGRLQPTKLMLNHVRRWAKERGNRVMHLGGGVGGVSDSLLQFKSGFSPLRHPYQTLRVVVREDEYSRLVASRDPSLDSQRLDGYFPLYRQP
jgi:lipid II:glycine glycyltransferase (peptidoglycan interpeptide bridge formation enzyme)